MSELDAFSSALNGEVKRRGRLKAIKSKIKNAPENEGYALNGQEGQEHAEQMTAIALAAARRKQYNKLAQHPAGRDEQEETDDVK